jgi:hypothetical protein
MPNWCANQVTISGPRSMIDEIKAVLNFPDQRLLNWMVPMPESERENWYDWCCANWGTKWDVNQAFISDDTQEDLITFSFDTAWAPPLEAFRTWASNNENVIYRISYYEPGMAFVGWESYDGEFFDEDYVEGNQDEDRYWEMAQEEFGVEREEEPEPLTEWYTQGVRDKELE